MTKRPPKQSINAKLRTGYSRLRHLAEHNHKVLLAIIKNDVITAELAASFAIDENIPRTVFRLPAFLHGYFLPSTALIRESATRLERSIDSGFVTIDETSKIN